MPSSGARQTHYMEIRSNVFVELNLVAANYNGGLDTVLGLTEQEPDADTASIVGSGFESALKNGAVPVRLVYKANSGKLQTAKVVCSPATADTVFQDAIGQKYGGQTIVEVRFPRRRVYTW